MMIFSWHMLFSMVSLWVAMLLVVMAAAPVMEATTITFRGLQGVNACAAYDIIVPMIEDGENSCVCDGRTIVCNFDSVCDPNDSTQCAALKMDIDLSQEGHQKISYQSTFSNGQTMLVDLGVTGNITEGLRDCAASIGGEGETSCQCTVCNNNFGVNIDCGGSTSTGGCTAVDLQHFERFVPFQVHSSVVARSAKEGSAAVSTRTTTLGGTLITTTGLVAAAYWL